MYTQSLARLHNLNRINLIAKERKSDNNVALQKDTNQKEIKLILNVIKSNKFLLEFIYLLNDDKQVMDFKPLIQHGLKQRAIH